MSFLQEWDSLIRTADIAFAEANNAIALPKYHQALELARNNFEQMFIDDADRALSTVTISFYNIAETYATMRRFPVAIRQFNRCYHFLNGIMQRTDLSLENHMALSRAFKSTEQKWKQLREAASAYPMHQRHIQGVESSIHHIRQTH